MICPICGVQAEDWDIHYNWHLKLSSLLQDVQYIQAWRDRVNG